MHVLPGCHYGLCIRDVVDAAALTVFVVVVTTTVVRLEWGLGAGLGSG